MRPIYVIYSKDKYKDDSYWMPEPKLYFSILEAYEKLLKCEEEYSSKEYKLSKYIYSYLDKEDLGAIKEYGK